MVDDPRPIEMQIDKVSMNWRDKDNNVSNVEKPGSSLDFGLTTPQQNPSDHIIMTVYQKAIDYAHKGGFSIEIAGEKVYYGKMSEKAIMGAIGTHEGTHTLQPAAKDGHEEEEPTKNEKEYYDEKNTKPKNKKDEPKTDDSKKDDSKKDQSSSEPTSSPEPTAAPSK